ncbi:MAG: hypothetical protein P8N02_05015, partial [Actinomycetota bacterium]|nr:hypothetical protein [Actinomycetota bacterium]
MTSPDPATRPMTAPTLSSAPSSSRRRWLRLALGMLLVLGGAELASRVAMSRLPEPLIWPRYEVQRKVDHLDDLGREGCVDAVVLGSSVSDAAIDPAYLDGDGERTVYNASLAAAESAAWLIWAEEVVIPTTCPRTAIIAVTVRDLNDSTAGDTTFWESLEQSLGRLERIGELDGWSRAKKFSWDQSALFAMQRSFRNPSAAADFLRDGSGEWAVTVRDNGLSNRFRGIVYDDRAARQNHDRGIIFADYEVGGARTDHIRQLAQTLQRSGASVILVSLPFNMDETISYLDDGLQDLATYEQNLVDLSTELDVRLIDMVGLVDGPDFFADDYHVNGDGADVVSAALR